MIRRLAMVLALAAFPAAAWADTVILKNGRHIEGRVVEDNEREVTVEIHGGSLLRFDRKAVASVEKEGEAPADVKATPPEDIGVPDGATDDEVTRLETLVPQLRDTARRYLDTKAQLDQAQKTNDPNVSYLTDRVAIFAKQLESMKAARDAIERTAGDRYARSQRQARTEADTLHADTEKLKAANDATGLADRAQKLRARVAENPRDPRHAPFLAEALYAMESSGDVDVRLSPDLQSPEARVAGFVRAAEHFAWCAEQDEGGGERYFKRATDAYGLAHRAAGLETRPIELALENLQAYRACAALIEERSGERRWGAELAETEAGQYRIEFKDHVGYGNDVPATREPKVVFERRDRTENRAKTDANGKPQTLLVKVTRWYQLVYDAQKKRWGRETQVTDLETNKLIPLLRDAQDRADALAKAKRDRALALKAAEDRRQTLRQVRHAVEQADQPESAFDKAQKDAADQAKLVAVAQDAVAQAQAALGAKQGELAELERAIEKARTGE